MSFPTLLIGGDTVPGVRDNEYFIRGDHKTLFKDLLTEIESVDCFTINLECPLTNSSVPLPKIGPNLRTSPACVNGLTVAHAVGIANNHILDYGAEGVLSTIQHCRANGILTFGAGRTLLEARRPLIREINGCRVGFVGVAENEFASATATTAGAYGLDLIDLVDNIRELRLKSEFCIVLYHGGNEYYPYPSPRLQDLCRFLVREGANVVVCQHSHCAGCYERYKSGLIVYGQGNLIFSKETPPSKPWMEGFLVKIQIKGTDHFDFSILPYAQAFSEPGVQKLQGSTADEFMRAIHHRSEQVLHRPTVESLWADFCQGIKDRHLGSICLPQSRLLLGINRRIHLADRMLSGRRRRLLLNLLRCESHHEAIKTLLKDSPRGQC